MKKVVVTRENYEEVMFDLLENAYESDVREDVLRQIDADLFLAFEWKQWSKAHYSEGLEVYKSQEAEFIESLVREEKKGFVFPFYRNLSWAAVIALFVTLGWIFIQSNEQKPNEKVLANTTQIIQKAETQKDLITQTDTPHYITQTKSEIIAIADSLAINSFIESEDTTKEAIHKVETIVGIDPVKDTIDQLIAKAIKAMKPSRFKITVTESSMDDLVTSNYSYSEKRYTMADVINRKDGITLSKFLDNSTSRVVKTDNKTYIEYTAEDNSVLILTLSN